MIFNSGEKRGPLFLPMARRGHDNAFEMSRLSPSLFELVLEPRLLLRGLPCDSWAWLVAASGVSARSLRKCCVPPKLNCLVELPLLGLRMLSGLHEGADWEPLRPARGATEASCRATGCEAALRGSGWKAVHCVGVNEMAGSEERRSVTSLGGSEDCRSMAGSESGKENCSGSEEIAETGDACCDSSCDCGGWHANTGGC